MPADDGDRRACRDNSGAPKNPFIGSAAQGKGGILGRAGLTHCSKAGIERERSIFDAYQRGPLIAVNRLCTIIAPRVACQMNVQINQPGQDSLGGQIDDGYARRNLSFRQTLFDGNNASVGDSDRCRASGTLCRVGDQIACQNHLGFGESRRSESNASGCSKKKRADHIFLPKIYIRLRRRDWLFKQKIWPGKQVPRARNFWKDQDYQKKLLITSTTYPRRTSTSRTSS